jgi:hypothetical protein
MSDLNGCILIVRIKSELRWRVRIAILLIRLAARVLGCGIQIEEPFYTLTTRTDRA